MVSRIDCMARRGMERHGVVWCGRAGPCLQSALARLGWVWYGKVWFGVVRHGLDRLGRVGFGRASKEEY